MAESAKDLLEKMKQIERTTGPSGAIPNATKEELLNLSDLQAKHPDKHLRFVNVANPDKVSRRQRNGYIRLPEADGGRQIGNLAVFAVPKQQLHKLQADKAQKQAQLLVRFKAESHQEAEATARILRDRHGIDVDPRRLIAE